MADQVCIVCGNAFGDEKAMKWMHDGKWLVFDDLGCRNKFIGNPKKYLEEAAT